MSVGVFKETDTKTELEKFKRLMGDNTYERYWSKEPGIRKDIGPSFLKG